MRAQRDHGAFLQDRAGVKDSRRPPEEREPVPHLNEVARQLGVLLAGQLRLEGLENVFLFAIRVLDEEADRLFELCRGSGAERA